jgi:hypothetical protein
MTALAVASVVFLTVAAQAPVDFSGTWIRDATRSSAVGGGRGAGGGSVGGGQGGGLGLGPAADRLVVTQSAQTLTIEEHRGDVVSRLVYRLDGGKATNAILAGRSAGASFTSTSAWKDGRLATTITYPTSAAGTDTVVMEETRSIDRDGFLVVETAIKGQPSLRRSVYARPKSAW